MSAGRRSGAGGFWRRDFWRRTWAMLIKEFIQLKRDRVSFAIIVMIPLMQLLLFGYAINTNPRHLPTAVLLQEQSDVGRSILKALENTKYFEVTHVVRSEAEFDRLLASGTVLFAIEIPANFERAVRRGDRPALLVAADATYPVNHRGELLGGGGRLLGGSFPIQRLGSTQPFQPPGPHGHQRVQDRGGQDLAAPVRLLPLTVVRVPPGCGRIQLD